MRPRGCGCITHLDLTIWRDRGRPLDQAAAVERLAELVLRTARSPSASSAIIIVMDAAAFATLDRLLALVQDHPRATLAAAGALFGEGR